MDDDMTIDPIMALKLLPQKIDGRKEVLSSLLLDLAVATEAGAKAEELAEIKSAVAMQRAYLAGFESRLAAIQKAANGG